MAKKSGGGKMLGPMTTPPNQNLGPTKVSAPSVLSPPDPMGFAHGKLRSGPSPQQRTQSHEKE